MLHLLGILLLDPELLDSYESVLIHMRKLFPQER